MNSKAYVVSWNDIRNESFRFVKKWKGETSESGEAKSFWDDFFRLFGLERRHLAIFEKPIRDLHGKQVFIDLFWKGRLIVEHKSYGKDLGKALDQAFNYCDVILNSEEFTPQDLPRYLIVSDFNSFIINDLESKNQIYILLEDLPDRIHEFAFILGHESKKYDDYGEVNYQAAQLILDIHNLFVKNNYSGHNLQMFMTRLVLCFFADDTGIFQPADHFTYYLEEKTNPDGSDLGYHLNMIFQILNTPKDKRMANLDEDLAVFPFLNGEMFSETIMVPSMDHEMRALITRCSHFDWSKVSPAIFGSLFQVIMDEEEQSNLGAHFTAEKNIMKIIGPIFLDDVLQRLGDSKGDRRKLESLLNEIRQITILDPACGSGNFLIVAYRELRRLELNLVYEIQKEERKKYSGIGIDKTVQTALEVSDLSKININQMFGIEIHDFAVQIAKMGLWIIDHQMNIELSYRFGEYYVRIPFVTSPSIINANALESNWEDFFPKEKISYIIGNPPFKGKHLQSKEQKDDLKQVTHNKIRTWKSLDYVTGWFIKAAEYIQDTSIKVGFVATNSISQGTQPAILWDYLFKLNVDIIFAHRTFKWNNELPGSAQVHVIILGFNIGGIRQKDLLYDYPNIRGEPILSYVTNISPYLIDFPDVLIERKFEPISGNHLPQLRMGSKPVDNGFLIFNDSQRNDLVTKYPDLDKFVKPLWGAEETLNKKPRWCVWLKEATPNQIRTTRGLQEILEKVKNYRLKSENKSTNKMASYPYLFAQENQPKLDFLGIPETTTHRREYIPFRFFSPNDIITNKIYSLEGANMYHFGILSSKFHMIWVEVAAGRLKSDYTYGSTTVYNTFPWPLNPSQENKKLVEALSTEILQVREKFHESSLADLYDPISMPKELNEAHKKLDKVVEKCYRSQPFSNDLNRLTYLFNAYLTLTSSST